MLFIHTDDISQYVFDEKKYWKFTKDQYDVFVLRDGVAGPHRNEPILISLDKEAKTMTKVYYDGYKCFEPYLGVT
jgi:hypothetical protein